MEKLKLNIQMFNDGTTTLNLGELTDAANQIISNIAPHIADLVEEMMVGINNLISSEEFKTISSEAIQSAMGLIMPYVGDFQDELTTLGNFVIGVVNSYELSDEALRQEFEQWGTTIRGSIEGIKSSFTAGPDGTYNFGTYVTDMSGLGREAVGLATQAIVNTNKLTANLTGMSVADTLSTVTQSAIGSFGSLLSGSAETATRFLGFLMGGAA